MKLGPLDCLDCDAPAYTIVLACALKPIEFIRPADVRWCRLKHLPKPDICVCGRGRPKVEEYVFSLADPFGTPMREVTFRLGQCRGCGTCVWD